MALREMMEMKETMGGQGMPQSLDTMAAVRGGGMPPKKAPLLTKILVVTCNARYESSSFAARQNAN